VHHGLIGKEVKLPPIEDREHVMSYQLLSPTADIVAESRLSWSAQQTAIPCERRLKIIGNFPLDERGSWQERTFRRSPPNV